MTALQDSGHDLRHDVAEREPQVVGDRGEYGITRYFSNRNIDLYCRPEVHIWTWTREAGAADYCAVFEPTVEKTDPGWRLEPWGV